MLVEHPFIRERAYIQQGSYSFRKFQHAMEKQKHFPKDNFQVYHGASAGQGQGSQLLAGRSTSVAVISSDPIIQNTNQVSGDSFYNGRAETKSTGHCKHPKIKKEVFAFGPAHAEHARRLYQSKGALSKFRQDLVLRYQPDDGSMQVSYVKKTKSSKGVCFFGRTVLNRGINSTTLCTNSVSCKSAVPVNRPEAVLKEAKISPRPDKKQTKNPKVSLCSSGKLLNSEMDQGALQKSIDCQNVQDYEDLSNAPVFQLLCEISKL